MSAICDSGPSLPSLPLLWCRDICLSKEEAPPNTPYIFSPYQHSIKSKLLFPFFKKNLNFASFNVAKMCYCCSCYKEGELKVKKAQPYGMQQSKELWK